VRCAPDLIRITATIVRLIDGSFGGFDISTINVERPVPDVKSAYAA